MYVRMCVHTKIHRCVRTCAQIITRKHARPHKITCICTCVCAHVCAYVPTSVRSYRATPIYTHASSGLFARQGNLAKIFSRIRGQMFNLLKLCKCFCAFLGDLGGVPGEDLELDVTVRISHNDQWHGDGRHAVKLLSLLLETSKELVFLVK